MATALDGMAAPLDGMATALDGMATVSDRMATALDGTATALDRMCPAWPPPRFRPGWTSPVTASAGLERRTERVLAKPGAQGTV